MFAGDAPANDQTSFMNALKQSVFWSVHLVCLFVFVVGWSWVAVAVCLALYVARMFAITGGYHRYFSHRSYKTSRWFQFVLAWLGASAAQKGPLWWAGHHRHHHRHSDTPEDVHSAKLFGVWYAHVGWIMSSEWTETRLDLVKDFLEYPEIKFLEKWHLLPPVVLAVGLFFLGMGLQAWAPSLGTSGWQMLIWGFFLSTTLLYHGTFCINSFCHLIGTRRFKTTDESKNSFLMALITLGEGWHNNHHRYPGSERQGMFWWEIDITHYILKGLEAVGLVWDLRTHPERIYEEAAEGTTAH